jgi:hypothetical protein
MVGDALETSMLDRRTAALEPRVVSRAPAAPGEAPGLVQAIGAAERTHRGAAPAPMLRCPIADAARLYG